jgi:ABC-2 type transport system ATP-binding protein
MIETVGLGRTFDGNVAVEDLNLSIKDGEAFAFLGPNGAGKTTTVRMLCCLIAATTGTAYISGLDLRNEESRLRIREKIGLLPENPGLYESLGAHRNLDFYARLYGVGAQERERRIMALLKTVGLWDRREEAVGKFSKGMKQRVAIARALIHEPEYLFLDEPTAALDPEAAKNVREFLLELKKEGRTIFLNTHNLDEAQRICDRMGVLRTRLLAVGTPDELASRFYGKAVSIQMRELRPEHLSAVRSLPNVLDARQENSNLVVQVADPGRDNPAIVSKLVSMGAEVRYVEEVKRSLEDVYLRLMEGGG